MGKKQPADNKKKKDLRKRSLRLQKLQHQKKKKKNPNPNPSPSPNPNPYARFPSLSTARSSRRNPNPNPNPMEEEEEQEQDEEEEEEEPMERRKEKKLKLVLHLPQPTTNSSENRQIVAAEKAEGKSSALKATETLHGTFDWGPTTAKILDVILDRLQKKDIYGVFSEPVDPEELPDYHEIIKHPMDFGTVRKRLLSGAYKDLEQFEKDIFLISSNAMRYNAPDTIYFRQARSIHELAKKSFDNLRHEGDVGEPEPKIVRRGRPPGTGKNSLKRPERTGSEFSSEVSLANVLNDNHSSSLKNDLLGRGSGLDQQRIADVSIRPKFIHSSEAYISGTELKSVRNEDYSGSTMKGLSNYGKKPPVAEESRRNTYKQCQLSSSWHECPVLAALDGDRKILLQFGLHVEHAYARSLARFAAHLGPIGWKIAARRIEKILPLGTKFGPGWVGETDAHRTYHPSQSNISEASKSDRQEERLTGASTSAMQHLANGFKGSFIPNAARGNSGLEAVVAQAYTTSKASSDRITHESPSTVPRNEQRAAKSEEVSPTTQVTNHLIPLPCPVVPVDSQKPDLALQL